MGLMDKFKNLFTDEEIIEEEIEEPIEIKEVKKEDEVQKLPTFMRKKIEQEKEESIKKEIPNLDIKKELKLESVVGNPVASKEIKPMKLEEKNSFKFPLDLSDNDFVEKRSRQSIHHPKVEEVPSRIEKNRVNIRKEAVGTHTKSETKVADLYKDKTPSKKEVTEKKFRATPIISPIYGVLDKNYTPDDMNKADGENFEEKRHSKSVDFDSVRKKAYGSLTEEIKENLMCENCEYLKEAKECKEKRAKKSYYAGGCKEERNTYSDYEPSSEELYYDVLENEDTKKDITLDEATENYYDYGVEYQKENNFYEEETPMEEVKIVNHDEEVHKKKEIPPVKSSINLLSTLKKSMGENVEVSKQKEENLELTDDLFNLIDSMYDERNETK